MAYSDVYSAGARDHVMEVNDQMLAELVARSCPRCDCRQSRPIDGEEVASLPLRVCVQCDEVFGFDDSTGGLPHTEMVAGGGIWNNDNDEVEDYPRQPSPCFRDSAFAAADWSSGNDDEAVDRDYDQHHSGNSDMPRRGGRGCGRRGCGGGRGRGRTHHHGEEYPQQHHHSGGRGRGRGRGHRGRGGNGSRTSTSSNGSDPLMQVATTCLQSSKCALGAATDVVAGNYGHAVETVSNEMEPIGRAVGTAIGSVTGELIGSARASEIAAGIGSTVGRGMAEILKDSSLCNQRTSSLED